MTTRRLSKKNDREEEDDEEQATHPLTETTAVIPDCLEMSKTKRNKNKSGSGDGGGGGFVTDAELTSEISARIGTRCRDAKRWRRRPEE